MRRLLISFLLACSCLSADVSLLEAASPAEKGPETAGTSTEALNPVVQWNRILLVVVRTPGAQPATIHPTRSYAILHAAIYDAVNAIDRTHKPYAVHLTGVPRSASQDAAAAGAAHEVLVTLYPHFQALLDAQLLEALAHIPDSPHKAAGISIGQTVADQILALR